MRLSEEELGPDPELALDGWIGEARAAGLGQEPVFVLATVDQTGAADARLIVIRSSDERGYTFYNDVRSRKGQQLALEPRAALVGYWPELARQVRIRGRVDILPPEESEAAFLLRPRESQIGYWSNEQSAEIADRAALEHQLDQTITRFGEQDVPRPEHWAACRLRPDYIEFWQSGVRHLHDRIAYTRVGETWSSERLQP